MPISTAIDQSAIARVVGIKTIFRDLRDGKIQFLPQRIALFGQGNSTSVYAVAKQQIFSAGQAATLYGFGSPIHDAAKQLFPDNGDGVGTIPVTVFPLQAGGSAVVATGDVIATGTATRAFTGRLRIGGILSNEFVIPDGTAAAAVGAILDPIINDILDMPVTSVPAAGGDGVDLTVKWLGITGNDVAIEVIGAPTDAGITFAITAMNGGLVSPDITVATDQLGSVWETLVINAATPYTDTTSLDAFSTVGEARWDPLVRKPLVVLTATSETDVSVLTAAGDLRKTDRTNSVMTAPGSTSTPWAIAARIVARIARIADNNPARDYGGSTLTGVIVGADVEQWTYAQRDALVKSGIGTTEVKDGVAEISDTTTFYHPDAEPVPAYRFVKTITKLQQVLFNMDLTFNNADWNGAPLIPDGQPTTNRSARKPKAAVAAANSLIDSLGLNAIISDPVTAKTRTVAQINSGNPDRLDLCITIQVSGNVNIISADLNFGFFFGTSQLVA